MRPIKSTCTLEGECSADLRVWFEFGSSQNKFVQLLIRSRNSSGRFVWSLVSAFFLNWLDYCNSLLVDLPANLLQRFQSVQNSAARLFYRLCRSEHITDALMSLLWLRVWERVEYKVAVLTYKALDDLVLLAFTHVADMPPQRRHRSASTDHLLVPSYRRSTIRQRAFPITGACDWNGLPSGVTSAPSLAVFGRRLKTELFSCCYNAAWLLLYLLL